jgi:uncharacterized surface protein with fasciclin (FAS1) repeats
MRRAKAVLIAACALVALAVPLVGSSAAGEKRNIVRTAAGDGRFDTLVSLVKEAGLARTLRRDGPFTVFAPTDRAFSKVPDETLEELASDKDKLRAVLLYHVLGEKVRSGKLVKRESVETLNGQSLSVRVRDGNVKLNDARVTTADVGAKNGVIHVINEVLIPR